LLAAGFGSRLRPLTNSWPKCLMPIARRPMLDYWLQGLLQAGFKSVYVNTHYLSDIVIEYLNRDRFKGWVTPIYEKNILGTAGTIRGIKDLLSGESVLIAHADNWCDLDINQFIISHKKAIKKGCLISMATFLTEDPKSCGICEVAEEILVGFKEKDLNATGNIANGAIYIFEPEIIEWISKNTNIVDISTQVIPRYLGKISVWSHNGIFRDIGNVDSLLKAQSDKLPENIFEKDGWDLKYQFSDICIAVENLK
jgi:mannose-1-phosphate guanylyltransferase